MREAETTTRQRLREALRKEPATPSALAREFDLTPATVISHVEHLAQSLEESDEQLLAAPPECRDCGFDGYDDLLNRPSRCPDCKSESIAEPTFTVE